MAISIIVNGSKGRGNAGFLLAPAGKKEFPMPVALKTTDGTTVKATLGVVAPAGVVVELSQTSVSIGPTTTTVKITAKTRSKKAGDITLVVKAKSKVLGKYVLTSISNARIRFAGRFQARFATDGDFFNEPRGTSTVGSLRLKENPTLFRASTTFPLNLEWR